MNPIIFWGAIVVSGLMSYTIGYYEAKIPTRQEGVGSQITSDVPSRVIDTNYMIIKTLPKSDEVLVTEACLGNKLIAVTVVNNSYTDTIEATSIDLNSWCGD